MEVTGSSGLSTSVVSCGSELEYNIPDLTNSSVDNGLLDNPQKSLMMKHFHVPIEPEWEEDCAYLSKRKGSNKDNEGCNTTFTIGMQCLFEGRPLLRTTAFFESKKGVDECTTSA
ncbi:hypothetical protein HPP92_011426 [Vanilla planifolia]|uniref:Uncharacterized protein n=1 Tax=Vanilla planifolia TaxID=51239 RepID=A0A835QZ22_VANPL|nr:hypothetical protein HPP92_011426 [Vanilla planifolia]